MSVGKINGSRPVHQPSPMEEAASFTTGSGTSAIAEAMVQLEDAQQSARKMRREARRRQLEAQERQLEHMRDAADARMWQGIVEGATQMVSGAMDLSATVNEINATDNLQATQQQLDQAESDLQFLEEQAARPGAQYYDGPVSRQREVRDGLRSELAERQQDVRRAELDTQATNARKDLLGGVSRLASAGLERAAASADIAAKQAEMEANAAADAAQSHQEAAQSAEKHTDRAMDAIKQINEARREAERAANRV